MLGGIMGNAVFNILRSQQSDSFTVERKILRWIFTTIFILGLFSPLLETHAQTPNPPVLIAPDNNITSTATGYGGSQPNPPLAMPEFRWQAVQDATRYQIQFSQNVGFTEGTIVQFSTSNTTFIPNNISQFPDGEWYWRVRVDAPTVSNYSPHRSFTKQWASPDNRPVLISPINEEKLEFYDSSTFYWNPVSGAASYRLLIANNPDSFGSPIYNQVTLATTHQPLAKLANGTYYWRVVPLDPANLSGTPSEIRQFTQMYGLAGHGSLQIPSLIAPLDKEDPAYIAPTFTPTFQWTAVQGAQSYRLEYTSDPTCNFGVAGYTTAVDVYNTTYTPTVAFPNDTNYCWRVRAQSGSSISDWSEVWDFRKQWYIQPVPLTPVNNFQHVKYPYFSWTPVPGAAYYRIEICAVNTFPCPGNAFPRTDLTVNPYYVRPDKNWSQSSTGIWYWRVTPYDQNNNGGKASDGAPYPRPFSFKHSYESIVPHQVYPPYYYPPNDFPMPDEDVFMLPYEDRSVSQPIFMWHRVIDILGEEPVKAYHVQVATSPVFLPNEIKWSFKTENFSAAPTINEPFPFLTDVDYYWRVCSLASFAEDCQEDWSNSSQVGRTRFDPTLVLTAKSNITLLRPLHGMEFVEMTPLFEWWPLTGANRYRVQISQHPNFLTTVVDEYVPHTGFTPKNSLARRSLDKLDFGTYYWRVHGYQGSSPVGNWSTSWRFQIASQSQWRYQRTLNHAENKLLVAIDASDVDSNYDLTNLFTTQDKDYWYFGFNVSTGSDMAYGLYIDLNHIDGSGATYDDRGYNITTISAHRPEYAIYFLQRGGNIIASQVLIYRWMGSQWTTPQTLAQVGGGLEFSSGYLEIRVPNTAIGMGEDTSSASLSLFSVNESSNNIQDALPPSTNLTILDRFTSVSERINPLNPPTNASGDPTQFSSVPPFFFDNPPYTPWEGFNIQIAVDSLFTTTKRNFTLTGSTPYLGPPFYTEQTKVQDVEGDNTYYWRVRPQYFAPIDIAGSWSQISRFEREGYFPQNLQISLNLATPTFSWEIVEGAASYDLQVDNDPNFGSPEVSINTAQNTYTPTGTLANGTYYWRVRVKRDTIPADDWSPSRSFVLALPPPNPGSLIPNEPDSNKAIPYAPTFCWDPVMVYDGGIPVMAAYKYRVQVSRDDPNFSTIYDTIDTEQTCWTPTKGYHDGTYYWRVAMMDGQNRLGSYSTPAIFTKQYPTSTLVSPKGSVGAGTPIFIWTPVNKASSYKLEVSVSPTYSPLYENITTNNTRYTPTKLYESERIYYWRVAMVDKDNRIGPFNDATIILGLGANKVFIPLIVR
jgi:hypothetical protein